MLNIIILNKGIYLYNPRIVATVRMENLLKTIEQFLEFSDEKLEELSRKNQALRLEETKRKGEHMRKLLFLLLLPAFTQK